MALGAGVAAALRIVFAMIITTLMHLPYLKLVGGTALVYVAVKLLVPEDDDGSAIIEPSQHLWRGQNRRDRGHHYEPGQCDRDRRGSG